MIHIIECHVPSELVFAFYRAVEDLVVGFGPTEVVEAVTYPKPHDEAD